MKEKDTVQSNDHKKGQISSKKVQILSGDHKKKNISLKDCKKMDFSAIKTDFCC